MNTHTKKLKFGDRIDQQLFPNLASIHYKMVSENTDLMDGDCWTDTCATSDTYTMMDMITAAQ